MDKRRAPHALTPGPWKIQGIANGLRVLGGATLRVVAEVPARRESDARLIAAAPDLLNACQIGDVLGNEGPALLEYAADLLEPFAPMTADELRRKAGVEAEAIVMARGGSVQNA